MKPSNAWTYRCKTLLLLILGSLLLSACSAPHYKETLENPDWEVSGKIGVRESMLRATSSLFNWKQRDDVYIIHVFNSLGQPQFTLKGTPKLALLEVADGSEASASSPEQLLEALTGWSFPISATRQWLQGELQGNEENVEYDEQQRLSGFVMDGWQVSLNRYKVVQQQQYPHRIKLQNDKYRLTIIVKDYVDTSS